MFVVRMLCPERIRRPSQTTERRKLCPKQSHLRRLWSEKQTHNKGAVARGGNKQKKNRPIQFRSLRRWARKRYHVVGLDIQRTREELVDLGARVPDTLDGAAIADRPFSDSWQR